MRELTVRSAVMSVCSDVGLQRFSTCPQSARTNPVAVDSDIKWAPDASCRVTATYINRKPGATADLAMILVPRHALAQESHKDGNRDGGGSISDAVARGASPESREFFL